jgi:hypothetical protein
MKRKWKKREISQPRSRIDLKKANAATAASKKEIEEKVGEDYLDMD